MVQLKCLADSECSINKPMGTFFHPGSRAGRDAALGQQKMGWWWEESHWSIRDDLALLPQNLPPRLRTLAWEVAFG